jgi:hypothetical protein
MPLPLGVPPNFFLKQDAKYEYDMTTGTGVSMATLHTLREIRGLAKAICDVATLFNENT